MKSLLVISIGVLLSLSFAAPEPAPQGPFDAPAEAVELQPTDEGFAPPQNVIELTPVDACPGEFHEVIAQAGPSVFATLEISIDPKRQPLGAYQFQIDSPDNSFKVVGIEGGFHRAFNDDIPPYYDRSAESLDTERLIIAEYARPELNGVGLPTREVHVVTLHVMFDRPVDLNEPAIELTLMAAGDAQGNPIDAEIKYAFPPAE